MDVIVLGAGPTGIAAALLLSRAGHAVTILEADAGPAEAGAWERAAVYQFHQPHYLRAPTFRLLQQALPDVLDRLLLAGAEPVTLPGQAQVIAGMRSRRITYETTLREALLAEPGVNLVSGKATDVEVEGSATVGVRVAERLVRADLVVDASGRSGLTNSLRDLVLDTSCGFSYVSRAYRLRNGAEPGPLNAPPGFAIVRDGYVGIVFAQDNGWFQTLLVRATADKELAEVRHEQVWDAVMPTIPAVAAWIDPARSEVMGPPSPGNAGRNSYRGQAHGITGLLAIGDAVCTTNPMGARGISLGLAGAAALTGIVAQHPRDSWSAELENWCTAHVRPWFDDQIECDEAMLRRWSGEPLDPTARLPADLVAATGEADPRLMSAIGPYHLMMTTSRELDGIREQAQAILASGWRPPVPDSPSHADLVHLVRHAGVLAAG